MPPELQTIMLLLLITSIQTPQKVFTSGICLADISDHLPCFCTLATKLPTYIHKKFYRNFSHFEKELFVADLEKIDFYSLANSDDVNCSMNNIIEVLQDITDKHAPIKKVTNAKKGNPRNLGFLTVYSIQLKQSKRCLKLIS